MIIAIIKLTIVIRIIITIKMTPITIKLTIVIRIIITILLAIIRTIKMTTITIKLTIVIRIIITRMTREMTIKIICTFVIIICTVAILTIRNIMTKF